MTKYEIRKVDNSTYELVSIVRNNNRDYVNFVASGSEDYCISIKRKMENL